MKKLKALFTKQKWTLTLLVLALLWNQAVYYGGNLIARHWRHYDMELGIDASFPLLPWSAVIYFGSFLLWLVCYVWCARQSDKRAVYRFFCADFLSKGVCLLFFLALPTTNVRPPIVGNTFWDFLMRFLYWVDAPSNLFPSMHCLVSWLCFIGVRRSKAVPKRRAALVCVIALAICVSTLTTKQHVFVDTIAGVLLAELGYRIAGKSAVLLRYTRFVDRFVKE